MTLRRRYSGKTIAHKATALASIVETLAQVAATRASVLLIGESGATKFLAEAIHLASPRAMRPFAAVNCAELAPGPLAVELFGEPASQRGAQAVPGCVETCHGGTLLLQRIECTDSVIQSMLAEVMQEHQFRHADETTIVPADLRVIAATPENLDARMAAGRFREDLFYRLSVVTIVLPSAIRRREDITDVIASFGLAAMPHSSAATTPATTTPGRKRCNRIWSPVAHQIEHNIGRLLSEQSGMPAEAVLAALVQEWETSEVSSSPGPVLPPALALDQTLVDCVKKTISTPAEPFESLVLRVQRELITQVLRQFEGAQERAAEFLGITPLGLSNKLRELGLQ